MTLEAQVKEFEHWKALKLKMQFRDLIMNELDHVTDADNLEKIYAIQHRLCRMSSDELTEFISLLNNYTDTEDKGIPF